MEELVESYVKRAEAELKAARIHYDSWKYPACIASAQTSVELMLKALLKKFTGDFPKKHDVSDALAKAVEKLPEDLRKSAPRLCFISRVLSAWREPSIYGEELRQAPPESLFGKREAELAISYAEEVRIICIRYLP